jgi:hypothetical protein
MKYKISKKEITQFSASWTTPSGKSIHEYKLEKKNDGWIVKYSFFNVDNPFPDEKEIYLPNDIIDSIILKQHIKKELKK